MKNRKRFAVTKIAAWKTNFPLNKFIHTRYFPFVLKVTLHLQIIFILAV